MTAATVDLDADIELVHVDPRVLIIGPNVRRDPEYSELVLSVAARGVVSAITAHWNDKGELVVIDGQRRTLAAREARTDTVPVYVVAEPGDADRIVDQLTANTHREPLDVADTAVAYEQLTVAGMSPDEIAKLAAVRREHVDAGLVIARSPVALGTVRKYPQMTFDQGVALAEFEDDKDAVHLLVDAIKNDRSFEHVVQRVRDDREQQGAIDALTAEIRAAGGVVIDTDVPYGTGDKVAYLTHLRDAGKPLTVSSHETCDGHAAVVRARSVWNADKAGYDVGAEAGHVCLDWRKYGHESVHEMLGGSAPAKLTKAEKDAAALEKARLDAGDAAWVSATTVRRDWLRDLAQRRNAPDGADRYVLEQLVDGEFYIENDPVALLAMLGRETPVSTDEEPAHPFAAEVANAKPGRRALLSLWLFLAGAEDGLDQADAWRRTWKANEARSYLGALAGFGYRLAPIEQALVDGTKWEPPS